MSAPTERPSTPLPAYPGSTGWPVLHSWLKSNVDMTMMHAMMGAHVERCRDNGFHGRPTVICASADAQVREEVARVLADDFEVIEATELAGSLLAVQEHVPDLIVSDAGSGGIGVALLAALGKASPTGLVPAVLLVTDTDPPSCDRPGAREPNQYLRRPFEARELVACAHRHIALHRAQRAWSTERDRMARTLAEADGDAWVRATREVALLAEVEQRPVTRVLVDLTAIARQVVRELRAHDPTRSVDVQVADGLRAVADPALVTIALEQLLGNAWKFTRRRADAAVVVESAHRGVFLVRDNGVGFDMANSESLFRPYRRLHAHAEFDGAGLGLAIVHRIVERHSGEAWAHGRVDRGARVWFTLGAASDPDFAAAG